MRQPLTLFASALLSLSSLIGLIGLSGCGTLMSMGGGSGEPSLPKASPVYGGVQTDIIIAPYTFGLSLVDLPLSLVLDTLLLPYTLQQATAKKEGGKIDQVN
jgi:uncharacterized protein YceK